MNSSSAPSMLPFGVTPSADASLSFLSVASRDAAALLAGFVPAPEGQRFEGLMPLRTVAPESPAVLASLFSPTAPPLAQPSTADSVPSPSGETVAAPEDNPPEEPTEMVPAELPALPTFVESTPVAAGGHEVPATLSRDSGTSETAPIERAGEGQSSRRKTPRVPVAPEAAVVMAAPKATPDVANAANVVERAPVHVDGAAPRAPGVAKTNAVANPVVAATVATTAATIAPVATAPTAADVVEQPSQTVPPAATVKVERGVQRRPVETGETAMPVKLPATPLPAPVETVRIFAPAAPAAPVVETGSGPNHPIERGEVSVGARQSAVVAETAPSITSTQRVEPATPRAAEFALPTEGAVTVPGRRPEAVHGREPARPALAPVETGTTTSTRTADVAGLVDDTLAVALPNQVEGWKKLLLNTYKQQLRSGLEKVGIKDAKAETAMPVLFSTPVQNPAASAPLAPVVPVVSSIPAEWVEKLAQLSARAERLAPARLEVRLPIEGAEDLRVRVSCRGGHVSCEFHNASSEMQRVFMREWPGLSQLFGRESQVRVEQPVFYNLADPQNRSNGEPSQRRQREERAARHEDAEVAAFFSTRRKPSGRAA